MVLHDRRGRRPGRPGRGPGHYPQTALPGRPGNFAVAGHRIGRGATFGPADILVVRPAAPPHRSSASSEEGCPAPAAPDSAIRRAGRSATESMTASAPAARSAGS
ncbi:sortase domain-containing protein [Pseudonocardia bannensis]|uniref:sortase domain-containing protein n=1 Tax=Pseudonocardia bannensis TaxID=630973 RepID=UPI0034D985A2